jgi:hypothetical protein
VLECVSNRHCPKCQSLARAEWISDRKSELLDCGYFHVVFGVPEQIAALAMENKKIIYGILPDRRPHEFLP